MSHEKPNLKLFDARAHLQELIDGTMQNIAGMQMFGIDVSMLRREINRIDRNFAHSGFKVVYPPAPEMEP